MLQALKTQTEVRPRWIPAFPSGLVSTVVPIFDFKDSLWRTCVTGFGTHSPQTRTPNACANFCSPFLEQVPVLFAVDDWNALYWRSGYHEWGGKDGLRRRNILPIELRFAMAVR